MPPIARDWRERLMEKVDTSGDCWLWTGYVKPNGYGAMWIAPADREGSSDKEYVHRLMYRWRIGVIPPGHEIDHLCRNRRCVRPNHLEAVTNRENQRRGFGFSGVNARKTHCPHGHPYDAENTYVSANGHRQCKACRERKRAEYMPAYAKDYRAKNRDKVNAYKREWRAKRRAVGLPQS